MSSRTAEALSGRLRTALHVPPRRSRMHSAAWRISLWATLAFTCGTIIVFIFLDRFVASDIQHRSDAWLSGEVEVLGDVAERTPDDALYGRVLGEVAELATREVPVRQVDGYDPTRSVFFLQTTPAGSLKLWVGYGTGLPTLQALRSTRILSEQPTDVQVSGFRTPFRVASAKLKDGSRIFLGLSERDERRILRNLRVRFFLLWLSLVTLAFAVVFFTTRRTLRHVRQITEAASRIGASDLAARVPTARQNDEIGQLALTLNRMLDRIENSMHQLHTITDALAHDLRSPLTAIRGKLETSLSARNDEHAERIGSAIDELDRLTDFLNKSLDVAEAKADALRLSPAGLDLDELLRAMVDVYGPSMQEKGLQVDLHSVGTVCILADAGLMHRMVANLFDNELKHVPDHHRVSIDLREEDNVALLTVSDDGPGFDEEIRANLFEGRIKGRDSNGHGLGLAFVDAVVRAHGGTITAANGRNGGAHITIRLPLASTRTIPAHSSRNAES